MTTKLPPREALKILSEGGEVCHKDALYSVEENGRMLFRDSDKEEIRHPSSYSIQMIIENCTLPPAKEDPFREVDDWVDKYWPDHSYNADWKEGLRIVINTAVKMAKGEG